MTIEAAKEVVPQTQDNDFGHILVFKARQVLSR
jgi:hypothetical protein